MKIIEFINKVYNEDIQKLKVRIKEKYYFYEKGEDYFKRIDNKCWVYCLDFNRLDDEIEIIEEEKKIELPDKLEIEQDTPNSNYYIKNEFGTKCGLTKHSKMIADKLNETLDYLKYKEEEKEK